MAIKPASVRLTKTVILALSQVISVQLKVKHEFLVKQPHAAYIFDLYFCPEIE